MPNDTIEFRTGTAADALPIGVAAMHVFLDTYATAGLSPSLAREATRVYGVEAFVDRLGDPATTFVLAERGDHLLGFAEITRERACPCPGVAFTVELVRLYVLPVAQHQGLGTSLLKHVEALLSAEGAPGLWLAAWSGNLRALSFYPAVGWAAVGWTHHIIDGVAYENRVFARPLQREP